MSVHISNLTSYCLHVLRSPYDVSRFRLRFISSPFRPHPAPECYISGSMVDGEVHWYKQLIENCPNQPMIQEEFVLKILVRTDRGRALVYLDSILITDIQEMLHPRFSGGGLIVRNGAEDGIMFHNLKLEWYEYDGKQGMIVFNFPSKLFYQYTYN